MKPILTEAEHARIQEAVAEAEGRTSGEIVPYIIERSDRYALARWRAGTITALLGLAVALGVMQVYDGWGLGWLHAGWGTALVALVAGGLGAALAVALPPVERFFAGADHLTRRVHARALQAFVEEEVFDTRDRSGILLFVSLFEHRLEVVGDAGINARVQPEEWGEVVARIQEGIRSGHLADGLVEAIGMCGRLLERAGVEIRPDDQNELSDAVRIRRGP